MVLDLTHRFIVKGVDIKQAFDPGATDTLSQVTLCYGAVLCVVGCYTTSLTFVR